MKATVAIAAKAAGSMGWRDPQGTSHAAEGRTAGATGGEKKCLEGKDGKLSNKRMSLIRPNKKRRPTQGNREEIHGR